MRPHRYYQLLLLSQNFLAVFAFRYSTSTYSSRHTLAASAAAASDDVSTPFISTSASSDGSGVHFSKAKWKKKRFLLLKDVMKLMEEREFDKASRKAGEAVRRMMTLYDQTGQIEYLPNVQAYNLWIHALAKTRQEDAGQQAESVLRLMQNATTRVLPSVITYTSVMDAYANQGESSHAERILMELIEECDRRNDLKVTSVTCDTVLNAWASQGTWEGAERAEEILKRLELLETSNIRPTAHSYATVIHGWATCRGGRDAALRAQEILKRLLDRSRQAQARVVEPDTVIFNAVMHAWANSGDPQAGIKANTILNQMQELHVKKKYDCRPDIVSYNTVLSAWSHSGHEQAGTRCEKILQDMLVAYRASPLTAVAPNTVSYNSVLHAWSNSPLESAATRAESVLNYMMAMQHSQKWKDTIQHNMTIAPDLYSFTSVLNAIAKSKDPDKASRAQHWLHRLLELFREMPKPAQPLTPIPFNTVMNACAFSAQKTSEQQRARALEVAVQTMSEMRKENIPPDAITYLNMIKCATNLLATYRRRQQEMAIPLFESCCKDGLVTELVWNQMCKTVAPQILDDHFQVPAARQQYWALPRSWKRKVRTPKTSSHRGEESSRRRGPAQRLLNIAEPSYQWGRDL